MTAYPMASWFETRGVAALLTMRVQDLILRRREAPSRRMKPPTSAVGEVPVQLAGAVVERPRLQRAVVDPDDRRDLGEIAAGEDLVRALKIWIFQRLLDDGNAIGAQQIDHPLPGDAVEESPVRRRRKDYAVLRHEDVRVAEFRDVAEHVEHQA